MNISAKNCMGLQIMNLCPCITSLSDTDLLVVQWEALSIPKSCLSQNALELVLGPKYV